MITIIAAVSANNVIGLQGSTGLLWDSQIDAQFFKDQTLGKVVVMGHNTFKSLGKPLINRTNIVLSRTEKPGLQNGVYFYNNITEILLDFKEIIIIGGAEVYRQFINIADAIILTSLSITVTGNPEQFAYFCEEDLEEQFFHVYQSDLIKDIDQISGQQLNLIISNWAREIKELH